MAGAKRFPPSARKLKKAREEGDVPKSRDITKASSLLVFGCVISMLSRPIGKITGIWQEIWREGITNTENVLQCVVQSLIAVGDIAAPVIGAIFVTVVLSEVSQAGFQFSFKPIVPKASRFSFVLNLKRSVGLDVQEGQIPFGKLIFEIFRGTTVIGVTALLIYQSLISSFEKIFLTSEADREELVTLVITQLRWPVGLFIGFSFCWGVFDYSFQRKRLFKRLGMDMEEIKQEFKETEGNPEILSMRKQLHQELMMHDIVQNVRQSKVLVVNE